MRAMANLDRDDVCAWIEARAALLRHGRLQDIDADLPIDGRRLLAGARRGNRIRQDQQMPRSSVRD
jgi:hypothetical protein